jgi:hypothetical protein
MACNIIDEVSGCQGSGVFWPICAEQGGSAERPPLAPFSVPWHRRRAAPVPPSCRQCAVWNSYDEIIEACKTAWNWLIADPDRIRSIGSRPWATVNV